MMNPYEPSQVTELTPSQQRSPEYIPKLQSGIHWIILRKWFLQLWIYCCVLAIVFGSFWLTEIVKWWKFDYGWALGILAAIYLIGPMIEWIVTKQRQRLVDWGTELFAILTVLGVFVLLIFIAISMLKGFTM